MNTISVTKARENIYQLLSDVNNNSQPITITNNRGKNAVLISEEDWNAIQETIGGALNAGQNNLSPAQLH